MTVKFLVTPQYTQVLQAKHDTITALEYSLRYMSPKANEYNPAFASGQWDGFVKLFDRHSMRFPSGLIIRAMQALNQQKIEYEVVSQMPELTLGSIGTYVNTRALRYYQEEAVAAALQHRRGLIEIPTGGGKTLVSQEIIQQSGCHKWVVIVPSTALLEQTASQLQTAFPGITVYRRGNGHKDTVDAGKPYILVAIVNSAVKHLTDAAYQEAGGLIYDEAHHLAADSFQQVSVACPKARYILGLTATPYRDDGRELEMVAWSGPVIYRIGYEKLIDEGFLVPPRFETAPSLEHALKAAQGLRTLVFAEKVQDLEKVRGTLESFGAVICTGSTSRGARETLLESFRQGDVLTIAVTPLFDEGVDIPSIECVIFFATGRGRVRTMQRIGRAMRPLAGKKECLVIDVYNKTYYARRQWYMMEPAFNRSFMQK